MIVRRGRHVWEIPDGCRQVRPSAGTKETRQNLAADLAEMGIELWAGHPLPRGGVWILAPEEKPIPCVRLDWAWLWAAGLHYGIARRNLLVRRFRRHHRTVTEDAVRTAPTAGAGTDG